MNELPYIMNTEKKSISETNGFAPVLPKKTRKRFSLLDSKVCEVADTNTEQHDIKDHMKKSLNAKLVSCDKRLLETLRYSDETAKMYTRHQETLSERCFSDTKCEQIVSYFDDLLNELSIREEQGKAKKFHEFENLLSICFDDNNSCASFLQIYNCSSLDKKSLPNSDQNNCFQSGVFCDISGNVKNNKFEIDSQNVENLSSLEDCKHICNENDRKIENAAKYDLRECSSKDLHNGKKVKNQSVIAKDIPIMNELKPEGKKENVILQENLIPTNTDHLWITSKLWSDSKIVSRKANNASIDKTNHNPALKTSVESSEIAEFQSILIPETTVPVFEKRDGYFKNANNIPNSGIVCVAQKGFTGHSSILEENQVVKELNETEKIKSFDKNLPELLKTPIMPKFPDICVSQNLKCFIQSQKQQKLLKHQACSIETNVFSGCTDVMKDDRNNSSFQNYVSDLKASNSLRSYSSSQACKSVIPCSEFGMPASGCYKVNLHIEGKNVHLGPIPFEVFSRMTLRLLKIKVEQELGIKTSKQMWILCNAIANNNDISLWDYGVKSGSHMFLYLDSELETFDIKIGTEYNNASTSFDKKITNLTSNVGKDKMNFKKLLLKCKESKEHRSKIANLKIIESSVLPNSKETVGVLECSSFINMNPYNSFENANDPLKNCSEITLKNNEDLANTSLNSKDTDENSRTVTSETVEEFDYSRIGCKEYLSVEKCKSSCEENHETKCSSSSRESEDVKPLHHSEIEHETCEKEEWRRKESLKETEANYNIQLETESLDLVENAEDFICPVCFGNISKGNGIVLHDCLHSFCRDCLSSVIKFAEGTTITCPYSDETYSCHANLQQREIKALVDAESYEKHLQRSIITAESLAERSFHCKTPDCTGWCVIEDSVYVFCCPACHHYNCLNCQAIHEGLNCRQYQNSLKQRQEIDHESEKTLVFLNNMMTDGKAMKCPKCDLILMKKWGCDWLKCSICKTEICWITKGPRWGPKGQGDTSAGCKCGVNGVKCHPSCTYCH